MADKTFRTPRTPLMRYGALPAVLAAALGTQPGCTREFFREWANQDVSEAVFEKSRDPRWRLDTFSIEPPSLSRFADPYDQDFPPAPPDDPAAEALSPVPQAPDNRLLIPAEGTGYLELLEKWSQEREALPKRPKPATPAARGDQGPGTPTTPPGPTDAPSPFSAPAPATPPDGPTTLRLDRPRREGEAAPVLLADARKAPSNKEIPPPRTAESFRRAKLASAAAASDPGVRRSSYQDSTQDRPLSPAPAIPLDPNPQEKDMADPNLPRPNQMVPGRGDGAFTEAQAAELSGILVPSIPELDEAIAAGLPSGYKHYKVNMQQAFTLALINSRFYQTQLETLYTSALSVTLQRFSFQPQFYAGLSPTTSPLGAGFPALNPANVFNYQTRYSPGGQVSTWQISEVAGVGKLLSSGGRVLMGFANQIVFNFVGSKPFQPNVSSSLPLTFFQPLLRGGGRAVTLENLTLAERSLLYQVRAFAKFRQEFIVSLLIGGTVQQLGAGFNLAGFSTAGNSDSTIGFIPVVLDAAQLEIDKRNVAYFEQLVNLYTQLIDGEASGLTQLQVDQARSQLVGARSRLVSDLLNYRNGLDNFKTQLGMPTDTPMTVDLGLYQPFRDVFNRIDDWQRNPKRDLKDLPSIVGKVPELEDVVIDGRSVLNIYKGSQTYSEEEGLEDILQAGVRTAMEYRLDLMNNRAQLYDAWRQIRFQANSLKGILNVGVTNQLLTPPTTTNPFGFDSQSSQLSLVLNAELPLIRLSERNNFRQAIINYQRQRRALQNAEDSLKLFLRQDIRGMQVAYINYAIAKQQLELNIRLKDQAFEQIVAPPQATTGNSLAQSANAATQTSNLIGFQNGLINSETALLTTWQNFQLARLTLYRDIGTLPYDEWEAFSELFPAEYRGPSLGPGTSDTRPAAAAAAETP
ncbi:TolC family protein [Paludisphaera mucosa]|uniref:TolC family protein n=1 Tax=Paludisphaera mucosa TaxID=3030827 RepID=A0ABT6F7V5_9BACT|nr:TolC family protein [Paludisphaera mucosa]MDG3003493.1 TolC family protein [Paludisphaera mucosa]